MTAQRGSLEATSSAASHADDDLRISASRHRFLAELATAVQSLSDPSAVLTATARMLAEHLGADRCAYAEAEEERVFVITGDYACEGVASIVGRWPVAAFGSEFVRCMLGGEAYVVEEAERDPRISAEDLTAYRATTICAVVCVPLHKHGRLTAAMAVHQTTPRAWTTDEIELVRTVVARSWEALERARVARTLMESEARYRTMVQASPECVMVVSAHGALQQINPAGLVVFEARDESDLLGRSVYDFVAAEQRDAFRDFNERVCRGESGRLVFDVVAPSGARRTLESTAVPLSTASGALAQLSITRDVTQRVAADRALADSRARVDYAVRLSRVGFWYCDLPFDELIWDTQVKEHFFLPPDARVTIDTFYERIHPEDRELTRKAIDASIQDRTSYDIVYRTTDSGSGAVKFIRALGGTAYAPDGTPTRFDGVTVDVTAQEAAQARLASLLEREQEQARLLKKVAEAALTIHAAGTVDRVLHAITEESRMLIGAHQAVTSLTADDDWSQALHCVSLSDKYAGYRSYEERPTGAGIYALVCASNRPMRLTQAELELHPAWRHFSGARERHPTLRGWLAVPFVGREGKNLGLIQLSDKYEGEFSAADEAILTQLAQVAAVAIENARLYETLREQDRRKDEFLATLAHELRNPLAPVRTGLEILRRSGDDAQRAKVQNIMERQLRHLVRMIDDLLDVSRVTLGKVTLERQMLDLRSPIESALESTRGLIEAHAHRLTLELPSTALTVEGDETRLAQVIANLLNNAAKYTPQGGEITLRAELDAASVVLTVRDNGIGIPHAMLGKVFEMFTQVGGAKERSQGGLGIGLTLVRSLVEMHGGTVDVHSSGEGLGSTFSVRLPRVTPGTENSQTVPEQTKEPSVPQLRVLVVDDNLDAAETLAALVELAGHDTRLAHSGPEAVSVALAYDPDVVFLDIGLPGFDGYETARRLRKANVLTRKPRLIALTGWGSEEDRRQAREAGFDEHLVKPADSAKVTALLAEIARTAV